MSYAEALAQVRSLAQAIVTRGLSPDRPILILSGNGVDHALLALGAMFEIPVLMLGLARAGVLSSATLRRYRRYAVVGLAVLAGLLPGTDPVTTLLEALPLFALYEGSIVLLRVREHRAGKNGTRDHSHVPTRPTDVRPPSRQHLEV